MHFMKDRPAPETVMTVQPSHEEYAKMCSFVAHCLDHAIRTYEMEEGLRAAFVMGYIEASSRARDSRCGLPHAPQMN
jgi:hypothetical protein